MNNKCVIVTAPNSHLGMNIVESLLENYYVLGISRTASKANFNSTLNTKYISLDLDLDFNRNNYIDIINQILNILNDKSLNIKALVNNAYYGLPKKPLTKDISQLNKSFEGMFLSQTLLSQYIIEKMDKGGSIVNICSMYGKVSPREKDYPNLDLMNPLIYGAMKAALIQSSKWLSSKYASKGIRVNSVSFGPFPSPDVQKKFPEFIRNLASKTHLNRIGSPSEASGIIKFLISDEASYITGADIPVDGGWTS